ncbi:MAG: type II secretion system protein, partial [Pseudomonadota bacterium]|nr:type II secretion system protein [Pseudomonadota bacterium]
VVGLIGVIDLNVQQSANPLIQAQDFSIAESLLDEVEQQPFTYCDPTDPRVTTATSAASCSTPSEDALPLGPKHGESRGSAALPLDNVSEYNGLTLDPVTDLNGSVIAQGYKASITVTQVGGKESLDAIDPLPLAALLKILVSVTGPDGQTVSLTGYRARYAPTTPP